MARSIFGRWLWAWIVGYLVLIVAIVWSVSAARQWALTQLATPESTAEWEAWREDVRAQQDRPSPVQRRVPKSAEPPALVLTRDYFAVVMCAAIFFSTLLYWILAWLLAGTLASSARSKSDRPAS